MAVVQDMGASDDDISRMALTVDHQHEREFAVQETGGRFRCTVAPAPSWNRVL